MKTILLHRDPSIPVTPDTHISLVADSAIVPEGRPLFLPDFAEQWTAKLWLAIKISRLGKNINPKFASRYYDHIALALQIIPQSDTALSDGFLGLFDGALSIGSWVEPTDPITISIDGATHLNIDLATLGIADAISLLSRHATLKMGDIVMLATIGPEFAITAPNKIHATLCGNPDTLAVKIL